MDRGALWATVHGGHKESDTTEHAGDYHGILLLLHSNDRNQTGLFFFFFKHHSHALDILN